MAEGCFVWPFRLQSAGTLRARLPPVVAVLASVAVGFSGCLPDKPLVADDQPLEPRFLPSIVQDPSVTDPLPGQVILAPPSGVTMPYAFKRVFQVALSGGDGQPLQYRFFFNRQRDCSEERPTLCGEFVTNGLVPVTEAGAIRNFQKELEFRELGRCYRVDLYISHEFKNDAQNQHLPVNPNDVLHARYFVVTPNMDPSMGTYPPVEACEESMQ